ncbi:transcriptional regulator family: Fungal Specific TF [Penicillium roqueforti]|nr:transcriptional regulator family: Fungal Specific TF [Penicillium roqueforti]KAI2679274.1 transcriptional regulator family: Fungal Specific TF [Penicillium roqueforti]
MVSPKDQSSVCQACRIRHISCDRATPSCRRCRTAGRPCTRRFNVRFSTRRNWVPPVTPLSPPDSQSRTLPNPRLDQDARPPLEPSQQLTRSDRSETPQWSSQPQTPVESLPADNVIHQDRFHSISPGTSPQAGEQRIGNELSTSSPLLLTSEDAYLMQYFGESIGRPWFDHTDSDFTLEVLRIAPSCPVLCYSILAVSSFYHCKATGQNDGRADLFHRKAIDILLALMHDPVRLSDGAGLASVVILRLYEESKARQDGQDAESHLLAGHVFAATIASDKQQPVTKLAKSAFWVHQRQDVFHSISQQKPTRTSLDVTHLWEPGDSDDIYTWTKRSQKLAGETADFCFGNDEAQSRKQHFEDLQRMLTQWSELSWPAFQPVFFADSDLKTGRILPEIRFALNACLTGYVHFRLSQLLLAMYNPSRLTLGPQAIDHHKEMESEVQDHVRVLCGAARFNTCPIGKVIACLAITLGHRWIHDPAERMELLELLRLCKQENAWANHALEQNLRRTWDLNHPSPDPIPKNPLANA